MEYLTILGVAILVSVIIGFYMFYCRLNDSNTRVKELERNIRILDETKGERPGQGGASQEAQGGPGAQGGPERLEAQEGQEGLENQGLKSRSEKRDVKGVQVGSE
ncbi:MAG: hypothetical protein WD512_17855, partial [Candidatus Paceibacterota bacterium]